MNRSFSQWTAAALCAGAVGCALRHEPPQPSVLEPAQIGSVAPAHVFGRAYLTGQPTPEDLAAARAQGVVSVINLRQPDELDFDEAGAVRDLGMQYHNPGFREPDSLTDAKLDEIRALLRDAAERPVLMHCASANRVGAVWLAHRVLDDGVDLTTALDEAREVGLHSAPLEERVRAYIDSRATAH